jgi:hypothetical protein
MVERQQPGDDSPPLQSAWDLPSQEIDAMLMMRTQASLDPDELMAAQSAEWTARAKLEGDEGEEEEEEVEEEEVEEEYDDEMDDAAVPADFFELLLHDPVLRSNLEVNECAAMTREDHRGRATGHCDVFLAMSKYPDHVLKKMSAPIPPKRLPLPEVHDGSSPVEGKLWLDEAARLTREYEDTIWRDGDPRPPCGTRATRIYLKRKAERIVSICDDIEARKKIAKSEAAPAEPEPAEGPPPSGERRRELNPKPFFSRQFMLMLMGPDWEQWMPQSRGGA